jgi:hypothetical protein
LAGNPVYTPGSTDIVPVGIPFSITWDPTGLSSTVSFVLLRGPGNALVSLGSIGDNVPNTGSYSWTPSTSLEDDVTHYGIQMIDDATGEYQYTTQFGVSNKGETTPPPSSYAAPPPASSSAAPPPHYSKPPVYSKGGYKPSAYPSAPAETESCSEPEAPYPTGKPSGTWSYGSAGTSYPVYNETKPTAAYPTAGWTASAAPNATYTPILSNDAGRFTMSFGSAVIALGAAVMLL